MTKEDLLNWHEETENMMKRAGKFELLDHPSQLYNWDQSGFSPNFKDYVGLFRKGSKRNHAIAQGAPKGHISTMWSVSADGRVQKPMILFKGKQKMAKTIDEAERLGFSARQSKSGYFTVPDMHFFMEDFVETEKRLGFVGPYCVVLDNFSVHLELSVLALARSLNITFISLFPNSTDVSQPLDLMVFKRIKDKYGETIRDQFSDSKITITNFAQVLSSTLKSVNLSEVIKKGFKDSGIFPWNSDHMRFDLLLSQSPTRTIMAQQTRVLNAEIENSTDFISVSNLRKIATFF